MLMTMRISRMQRRIYDDIFLLSSHDNLVHYVVFHVVAHLHTLKLPRTRSSVSSQLVCVQIATLHQRLGQRPSWLFARWPGASCRCDLRALKMPVWVLETSPFL